VWRQTAKLYDVKWNKISSKTTQLYIYINITFNHHSAAGHSPSMDVLISTYFGVFITIKNVWHSRVTSYPQKVEAIFVGILRVLLIIFRFAARQYFRFVLKQYKDIHTKPKLCNVLSVIAISNTLWISHLQYCTYRNCGEHLLLLSLQQNWNRYFYVIDGFIVIINGGGDRFTKIRCLFKVNVENFLLFLIIKLLFLIGVHLYVY